jgi:hypothetical protein
MARVLVAPCAIYRHSVCEGGVDVGRPIAVLREPSGHSLSSRCVPCANASRLLADGRYNHWRYCATVVTDDRPLQS